MGLKKSLLVTAILASVLSSCHEVKDWDNNARGNFEALWSIMDEHYCFFDDKCVNWDSIHTAYSRRIGPEMTSQELFFVCAQMLDEVRDGHVNLSAAFNTSYYRKWWSDYPEDYDQRLIQQHYFNFHYLQAAGLTYGFFTDNIGYIRYPSFSDPLGEGNIDAALSFLSTATGLIIDVRNNGGGDMDNVQKIVSRFITQPTLVGYISHKTGPGHKDFSTPRAYTYNPAGLGRVRWGKPVVVLANRGTFSAANNFVGVMKLIPGVKIAGTVTGGGCGMPFNSELPNGWGVRFSACPVYDANKQLTEFGVAPSPGGECHLDVQLALQGRDTMIEHAAKMLQVDN